MVAFTQLSGIEDETVRGAGDGCRVLVVDDERDTVMTLGILLRSEGFAVRTATSAATVRSAVDAFQPAFVLLDVGMPGRDGYQVAQELRSAYGDACPTLIAITGHREAQDRMRARLSGFHHHIGKPYNPAALIHLLSTLKSDRPA